MGNGDTEESLKYEKRREEQRTVEQQSLMRHDDALKPSKEAIVIFFVLSQTFSYLCVYINTGIYYSLSSSKRLNSQSNHAPLPCFILA